jgi:hypothetical protein
MKKINISILFFLISLNGKSQSITPATLGIAGVTSLQNNYTLTFSAGESISITEFKNQNNYSLNSGFLQNFTPLITGIFNNIELLSKEDFVITPNPTKGLSNLTNNENMSGLLQYQILDANSNILYISNLISINNKSSHKIDLTNYITGNYYIKIFFKTNNLKIKNGVFKIIKI